MRKARIILIAVLLSSALAGLLVNRPDSIDEPAHLAALLPGVAFKPKAGVPPIYVSEGDQGRIVAFSTYDLVPDIRGYAGPIKSMVALGPDGRIIGVRILGHNETRNYVHRMDTPEFLDQFRGKHVYDGFKVDKDIDGISRATVSVEALSGSVREASRLVALSAYGIKHGKEGAKGSIFTARALRAGVFGLIFMAAFGAYVYSRSRKGRAVLWLRDGVLAAAIIGLGGWMSMQLSIIHIYNALLFRMSSDLLLIAMLVLVAFTLAFAGRLYCGWLCGFGGIMEFVGRVPTSKWAVSPIMDMRLRRLKYWLLGASALLALPLARPELANYEPFVTLFSMKGSVFGWGLLGLVTLANLRAPRLWCRYLCPVGALLSLVSSTDKRYPSTLSCPMRNPVVGTEGVSEEEIHQECIRCNRCYKEEVTPPLP